MAEVLGPIGSLPDHALLYAMNGYEVFPVNPKTKAPLTPNGMKDATTGQATVMAWWTRWPHASIGHRLPANVVVLDIDVRHGGADTWAALVAEFGPFPDTREHYSGRDDGGSHVWFTAPEGAKFSTRALDEWAEAHNVGHHNGQRHVSGIDLLHRGLRYTILPPSLHAATSNPYRWRGSEKAPVAAMPAPLARLLVASDPTAVVAVSGDNPKVLDSGTTLVGPTTTVGDSIADWYSATHDWCDILQPAGWTIRRGDGNADGSAWRHPTATADSSATITHGCLFVYSPNTGFEVTGDGDPHGYTRFAAYALLNHGGDMAAAGRALRVERYGEPLPMVDVVDMVPKSAPVPVVDDTPRRWVDWSTFFTEDRDEGAWLYPNVLARGRGHAFVAKAKVGKSLLALHMAASMATRAEDPALVVYLDYEMSPDDLYERLAAMGYGPDSDLELLRYALFPSLPALDTREGGAMLLDWVSDVYSSRPEADMPLVVVIDTLSRAIQGEENSADTIRAWYTHTGVTLKREGHAYGRLDHLGKDAGKGARGSSAKNDDVDVVWNVGRTEAGIRLTRSMARMGWVPEHVTFTQSEDPLRFTVADKDEWWPPKCKEFAARLDAAGVPLVTTVNEAKAMLKAAGLGGDRSMIGPAIKWRQREATGVLLRPERDSEHVFGRGQNTRPEHRNA